ncbi:MAG: hypothetical protein RL660_3052 [Bacteroidota bacterium]|jgi:hypothetical protein
MKKFIEIAVLRKIQLIFILLLIAATIIFFVNQWKSFDTSMKEFRIKEITGNVTNFKDLGHGDFYVWLNSERYFLPLFKRHMQQIQINDSLYKPANSMVFQLYKRTDTGIFNSGLLKIDWR